MKRNNLIASLGFLCIAGIRLYSTCQGAWFCWASFYRTIFFLCY